MNFKVMLKPSLKMFYILFKVVVKPKKVKKHQLLHKKQSDALCDLLFLSLYCEKKEVIKSIAIVMFCLIFDLLLILPVKMGKKVKK